MAGLDAFRVVLKRAGSVQKHQELVRKIGRTTNALIREQFEVERDPYGMPWTPVKRMARGQTKILYRSGSLRRSIRAEIADRETIRVRVIGKAGRYGMLHQNGTRKLPRRAFMPTERGTPRRWAIVINNEITAYFNAIKGK